MPDAYRDFAGYYDRLMAGRYVDHWWGLFKRLAAEHRLRYGSVADLAGGTGEAARRFARRRVSVTVVDRSPEMLAQARRRVPSARLLRQDLRSLRLPEPVDLAVSVFGGINYLGSVEEIRRAFRRVHAALRPGGTFCVDAVTPHHLRRNFGRGTEVYEAADFFSVWRCRWDAATACSRIRVDGFVRERDAWRRHRPELHRHYGYPLPVLRRALREAGFSGIQAYGLPYGSPPTASSGNT